MKVIFFVSSLIFLLTACANQEIICNKPYILVGTECCLDKDDNRICDRDEVNTQIEEKETLPVVEEPDETRDVQNKTSPEPKPDSSGEKTTSELSTLRNRVVTLEIKSGYYQLDSDANTGESWRSEEITGSGFFFDEQGTIITNSHVVQGFITECAGRDDCEAIAKTLDGSEYELEWVMMSYEWDFAVMRVKNPNKKFPYLTISKQPVSIGEEIYALGAPLGYDFSMTRGIISQKDRDSLVMEGDKKYSKYLQTDAAINEGNSGGPIINKRGEVVGLASFGYLQREGLNFGLQSEKMLEVYSTSYNDTSKALDVTDYLEKDVFQSTTKDIKIDQSTMANRLFTRRDAEETTFESITLAITNNLPNVTQLCFDIKIISWLGTIGYDEKGYELNISLLPKRIYTPTAYPLNKELVVDSDYQHFYTADVINCETNATYGKIIGSGKYRN